MNAKLLKTVFGNSPLCFIHLEVITQKRKKQKDYSFKEINTSFEKITGLKNKDIKGKTVHQIFNQDNTSAADWIALFNKITAENGNAEFEHHISYLNKWFKVEAYQTENTSLLIVLTDITAYKTSPESGFLKELKTENFWNNNLFGVMITDKNGNYIDVNDEACRMTGYSSDELKKMNLFRIIDREKIENAKNHFEQLSKNGKSCGENAYFTKSGEKRWWNVVATKISDEYFLGLHEDITERKLAEEQLHKEREHHTELISNISDVIWEYEVDANGNFIRSYVSPVADDILDLPAGTVGDKFENYFNFVHPEDLERVINTLRSSMFSEENKIHRLEYRLILRNESIKYVRSSGVVHIKSNGNRLAYGTTTDITDIKKAEQALLESEMRYRNLSDATQEGIMIHYNGTIIDVNMAFTRMFGYENPEELIGKQSFDFLLTPESRDIIKQRFITSIKGSVEITGVRKNGSTFIVEGDERPIRYMNSDMRLVSCHDITERKNAEKEKAHFNELMKFIIENTKSSIAVHDTEMNYVYVSDRYYSDMHLTEKNIIGRNHYDVFPDLPQFLRDIHKRSLSGETLQGIGEPLVQADGSTDWANWTCMPWYKSDGEIGGIVIYIEVITERKRAEDALRQREERLIQQNSSLLALMSRGTLFQSDLSQALAEITEVSSSLIGTERVSIWLYDDDFTEICCIELYKRSADLHTDNHEILRCQDFPAYFASQKKGEVIAANDVYTDPRTCELPASYYAENNISSMLDTPVWFHNRLGGVLCFEHTGEKRDWTSEDIRLATSMAALLSLIFQNDQRKKSEKALQESQALFAAFMNHIPGLVMIKDHELRPVYGNSTFRERFPADEWIGKTPEECFPANIAVEMRDHDERALNNGFDSYEEKWQSMDGSVKTYETRKFRIEREGTNPLLGALIMDITDRKLAEEALKESELKYRTLIEYSSDVIFCVDQYGNYKFVNNVFASTFGKTPEYFEGKSFWDIYPKEHADQRYETTKMVFQTGEAQSIEVVVPLPDKTLYYLAKANPVRDEKGNIILTLTHAIDITDRKKIEEEIKRYSQIFEDSLNEIYLFDSLNLNFIQVNSAAQKNIGYSMEELVKMTPVDIKPETTREQFYELIDPLLSGKKELIVFETVHQRKDKSLYNVEVHLQLLQMGVEKIFAAIILDITERKRSEEELKQAQEKLIESETRYRLLAENSMDLIYVYSLIPEPHYEYISPSCVQLIGYEPEIGYADPFAYHQFINTPSGLEKFSQFLLDPAQPSTIEEEWKKKDGSTIWVEQVISRKFDDNGGLISFQSTVRDITQRKRAEDALSKSEERYRLISNVVSDYVFSSKLDNDGNLVLDWTAGSFETITGYSTDEYIAKGGWRAHLHPDDIKVDDLDMENLRLNRDVITQVRTYNKEGEIVWVQVYAHPIWDIEKGKLIGISGAVQNITDRKMAEETLKKSEAEFRNLFESANDAILIFEPDSEALLEVNQRACELYGFRKEDFIGMSLKKLSVNIEAGEKQIEKTLSSVKYTNFETQQFNKNGDTIHFLVNASVIEYAGRKAILSINRDITERKLMEEALRTSEENYQTIFNASPVMFWLKDTKNNIVQINQAAANFENVRKEDLEGKSSYDIYPPDQAEAYYQDDLQVIRSGKPKPGIIEQHTTPGSGRISWVETGKVPIKDNSGNVTGILVFAIDITDRKHAEAIFQDIINKNPISIQILDLDGYTIQTNEAHTTLFGVKPPPDYSMFKDKQLLQLGFKEIFENIKNGKVVQFPDTYYNVHNIDASFPDNPVWIKATGFPLNDSNGNPEYFVLMHENITDRKRAEEEINRTKILLKESIMQSPLPMVLVLVENFRIEVVNKATEDFLLIDANDYLEKSLMEIDVVWQEYTPDGNKVEPFDLPLPRALQGLVTQSKEMKLERKDGSIVWQLASGAPVFDSNGKLIAGLLIMQDVTDQKKAEEALRLRSLVLDQIKDHVTITDLNGIITYVNQAEVELMKRPKQEIIGQSINTYGEDPYHGATQLEIINQTLRQGEWRGEIVNFDAGGLEHYMDCRTQIVYDENGTPLALCGIATDVTERKKTEEKLLINDRRWHQAQSIAMIGNWEFDLATGQIWGSEEAFHIYGIALDKAANPEQILPLEKIEASITEKERVHQALIDLIQSNIPYDLEFEVIQEMSKEKIIIHSVAAQVLDEQGNLKKVAGVIQNVTAARKLEESLHESEKKFKTLFNTMPNGYYRSTPDGYFVDANPAFVQMLGYDSFDELKKLHIPTDLYVESIERDEILNTNPEFVDQVESYRLKTKSGNIIWIEDNARYIRDEKGNIIFNEGICKDVTDRKKAEKALKESEELHRKLITTVPDLIVHTDLQGKITFINDVSVPILKGVPNSTFIGENMLSFISDKDLPRAIENTKLMFLGNLGPVEYKLKVPDNSQFDAEVNGDIIYDAENKPAGMVYVIRDVTERKRTETALRLDEERLEALLKLHNMTEANESELTHFAMEAAVSLTGSTIGYVAFMNEDETILTMYAWSKQAMRECEIIDKPIVYPVSTTGLWGEAVRQRKAIITNDYAAPNLWKKGTPEGHLHIKRHMNAPTLDGNRIVIVAGVGNKSTDYEEEDVRQLSLLMFGLWSTIRRRRAEEELVKAKLRAEESDRLKSAFLANMSHEIRTPMNGILGFADLLKDPKLTGDRHQKYIQIIEKSGKRMLNIINDIVDISKIEAGLMKLNMTESNINEQIEYIYTFFKPEAEAKGLKLSVNNPLTREKATLITDREKLYAILTNLVKNAIKYTEKGEIEIGCNHKDNFIEVYIKDTGIGIPVDRQQAVFERFIQADIEDKMARQGAGLGLAITKAYVEMMGGRIWLESTPGRGSVFSFTLPVESKPTEESVMVSDFSTDKTETEELRLNILIVEDDDVSGMLLEIELEKIGKKILKAPTGKVAVEIAQNNPDIDLILMDISLPEISGYEATRQIRKLNKDVIIIAQTAFALAGDKEKAIQAGCDDYISKPINMEELRLILKKYFENS